MIVREHEPRIFVTTVMAYAWCLFGGATALLACGCGGSETPCDPEPAATVRVSFHADIAAVNPFPFDLLTVKDASSPTGRRVALPSAGTPVIQDGLPILTTPEKFVADLNTLDGFGTWAPVLVPLTGPIDPASLPQNPEASVADGSSVFIAEVTPGSIDWGKKVPMRVSAVSFTDGKKPADLLVIDPVRALRSESRYAVVITGSVRAPDASALGTASDFSFASGRCPIPKDHPEKALLEGLHGDLAPLFGKNGLADLSKVAAAFTFTTQSVEQDLLSIRSLITSPGFPSLQVNFDPDGLGRPDVYTLADLPLGISGFPKAGFIDRVVRGSFTAPEFRDAGGVIQPGDDGRPMVQAMTTIPFILVLPAAAGPFPVAILQHGHGARKEVVLPLAAFLAERGIASAAIDLVEHGERPSSGQGFINFGNLPAFRSNFQQVVADQMRLAQAIGTLATMDFAPGGMGDGAPDLDISKITYAGHSLGGMVGSILIAVDPALTGGVLNVGGGGFRTLLRSYVGDLYPAREILELEALGQMLLERGDPIDFYRAYVAGEAAGAAKQLLLQEVIDDGVMPNAATEDLARSYGCPLVRPYTREIADLPIVDVPTCGWGLFQFAGTFHGFLFSEDDPDVAAAARKQITTFLESLLNQGTGRIEDPNG